MYVLHGILKYKNSIKTKTFLEHCTIVHTVQTNINKLCISVGVFMKYCGALTEAG